VPRPERPRRAPAVRARGPPARGTAPPGTGRTTMADDPKPTDPDQDPETSQDAAGGITAGALLLGGAGGYLLGSGRAARTAGAACTPSAGTTLLTSTPDAPSYARASRSTAVRSSSSVRSP